MLAAVTRLKPAPRRFLAIGLCAALARPGNDGVKLRTGQDGRITLVSNSAKAATITAHNAGYLPS